MIKCLIRKIYYIFIVENTAFRELLHLIQEVAVKAPYAKIFRNRKEVSNKCIPFTVEHYTKPKLNQFLERFKKVGAWYHHDRN